MFPEWITFSAQNWITFTALQTRANSKRKRVASFLALPRSWGT